MRKQPAAEGPARLEFSGADRKLLVRWLPNAPLLLNQIALEDVNKIDRGYCPVYVLRKLLPPTDQWLLVEELMFVSHDRERLINAMIYFAGGTKIDSKSKLFRLLYLLDFAHFRRTGRSVTGSNYCADQLGPVPVELNRVWNDPTSPLRQAIQVVKDVGQRHAIPDRTASRMFDESHFTPRQLTILKDLARRYRDAKHPNLTEVSDEDNAAYERSWKAGEGEHQRIPYELAISDNDPHASEIREAARESRLLEERTRPARGESA